MNPHLGMTEQSIRIQSSQQLQGENTDLLVVWPLQVVLLFLLFSQHIVLKYFVWFNLSKLNMCTIKDRDYLEI